MRVLKEEKADYNQDDNYNHSSSLSILSSPLLLIEALSRKSFSYGKLPLEPIKLTVLKLDGSSFDITVVKNPSVAQLKQAVEAAFSHLPKHGVGKVSWEHVWGQFCLCFEGQKLLEEPNATSVHGIKDGDQLQFVRHTSISYNLVKKKSKKRDFNSEEYKASPTKREPHKNRKRNGMDDDSSHEEDDDIAANITCECSWAQLFRRLFTFPKQKHRDANYKILGVST